MRRTRSQLRAAQIAELAAEQAAFDKSVKDAVKFAAFARCDAVEQLYELLDVKPERPIRREGKNGVYEVATDKEEIARASRLIDAVASLLPAAEAHGSTAGPFAAEPVSERSAETAAAEAGLRSPGAELSGLPHAS